MVSMFVARVCGKKIVIEICRKAMLILWDKKPLNGKKLKVGMRESAHMFRIFLRVSSSFCKLPYFNFEEWR